MYTKQIDERSKDLTINYLDYTAYNTLGYFGEPYLSGAVRNEEQNQLLTSGAYGYFGQPYIIWVSGL